MPKRALHFVEIPERSTKPRTKGLTLARDYEIGYYEAQDWMESVGEFIDFIKIRHLFTLIAPLDTNHLTMRKIQLYKDNGVDVNPGGIVFEMAVASNKVDECFATLVDMGFTAVEISENIIDMELEEKLKYTKMAKDRGLKVLFELGDKYPEGPLDVDMAAGDVKELLNQGADLIILEKSLIELSLGERGESPENYRIKELVDKTGLEAIVFEAEAVPHQAWLFNTFGPDVNIGPNLEPNYIAKLEATRRTLSREGRYTWLAKKFEGKSE
jgi:phosphosulfolactate synthase